MTAFAREAAVFVALAVAGAAQADPMVCRTEARVTLARSIQAATLAKLYFGVKYNQGRTCR